MTLPIVIDGHSLTIADVCHVARDRAPVTLTDAVRDRVRRIRGIVDAIVAENRVVYGVTTGFGKMSEIAIPPARQAELQLNLIRSHVVGVGPLLPESEVRAMMLLRANVLAKGHTGLRLEVLELLIAMLNAGLYPSVPEQGSVGASGDLAPLAHLAITLVGEGELNQGSERGPATAMLKRVGLSPVVLQPKEGVGLINGTQAHTAIATVSLSDALTLWETAQVAGAASLEALRGTPVAFDPRIHQARGQVGQIEAAAHLLRLLASSEIRESHRLNDSRVQDAYALRCMPQVHGPVWDALQHAQTVITREINAATDNPLVFVEAGEILSGGNFHGEPLALAFDYAAIAVADLGTISERRTERLVNPTLSGLPAFLTPHPGTNSGLMIAQVAAVSLIAENNVLAHPASVTNLPTSANKEDHVSMGMTAALKLAQIVKNVETILAIELMSAAQGLEFLKPLRPSPKLAAVYDRVRRIMPPLERDVQLSGYIEALVPLVRELHEI